MQKTTEHALKPRMRIRYATPLVPAPAGVLPRASFAAPYAAAHLRAHDAASLHHLAGQTMGTTWSVHLHNPRFLPLAATRAAMEAVLAQVIAQMSHWEEESSISRFNRAPKGTWLALPAEFFAVLECALHWARESGGAWDPTLGALVAAWGFGPAGPPRCAQQTPRVPSAEAIAAARARCGWQRLALRPAQRQALQSGGVQLDLSGIAKGYAVDWLARRLAALGWRDFLVEIGGELRAGGCRPGGAPWQVLLPATGHTLALRCGQSIATSGDRWHAFEAGGRRYSHSIDPRSGRPVEHALCSVSVLHAQCMQADVLATAITILGPQQGLAFAERHGIAALLCQRGAHGMEQAMTRALAAQLT